MILKLGQANSEESRSIGNPNNGEDAVNHGKSGGSLRSQSGNLKEGPVGIGESEGSQGSGQNGNQINENDEKEPIYESPSSPKIQGAENEEDSRSHGKSGGSLRSQPGTLKGGSVGHGKPGGSQGSGPNGSQTNENIYESLPLPGNPGNDVELKEDDISHGHPGGN